MSTRAVEIKIFLVGAQGVVEVGAHGVGAGIFFAFVEFTDRVDYIGIVTGSDVQDVDPAFALQLVVAGAAEELVHCPIATD